MKLQDFNYHTHTYRCGHAAGNEEEYVQAAIQAGFKTLGFSEHLGFEGWDDPCERIPYKEIDQYLEDMYALKDKYKNQIEIRVGFECEYFEDSIEHLKKYRDKCDYMICGQHAFDRKEHYYDQPPYSNDKYIEFMAEQVCEGMKSGLFKYVAHPDYFMLSQCEFTKRKADAIKKIAQCAKKYDVVLEINLKGPKYGESMYDGIKSYYYPNYKVFEIIAQVGTKVVFGYDAHHPSALLQREIEEEIYHKFKSLHLHFVSDLKL